MFIIHKNKKKFIHKVKGVTYFLFSNLIVYTHKLLWFIDIALILLNLTFAVLFNLTATIVVKATFNLLKAARLCVKMLYFLLIVWY